MVDETERGKPSYFRCSLELYKKSKHCKIIIKDRIDTFSKKTFTPTL